MSTQDHPSLSITFVTPARFAAVEEVEFLLAQDRGLLIHRPGSLAQVTESIRLDSRALILVTVSDAIHLKIVVALAQQLSARLKTGTAKIVVVSSLEHPELAKFLKKHGCDELISTNVRAKGLKVKLQRHLTLLEYGRGGHAQQAGVKPSRLKPSPAAESTAAVIESPPLEIADDCWILRVRAVRKVRGHWIIHVVGPGPNSGRWVRSSVRARLAEDAWDWVPRDPVNPFVKEGRWTFFGKLPEHRDFLWTFIGERPCLSYLQANREIARRFHVDADGNLVLPLNSENARKLLPLIRLSLEYELRLAPEKDEPRKDDSELEPSEDEKSAFRDDLQLEPEEPGGPTEGLPQGPKERDPSRLKFFQAVRGKLKGGGNGLFDEISDPKEQKIYLREAAETAGLVTIWTRGQRFRVDARISDFSRRSGTIFVEYPDGMTQQAFQRALADAGARDLMINANLRRAAIFFQQELARIHPKEDGIEIEAPEQMFQVQRRAHFRYRPADHSPIQVRLGNGPKDSFELLARNLSGDGLCLKLDPAVKTRRARLSEGDLIPYLSFRIYDREIRCAGRVRWRSPYFAGIQFVDLPSFESSAVQLFVMEESYEYLRRFLAGADG